MGSLIFYIILLVTSMVLLADTSSYNNIVRMVPRIYLILIIGLTVYEIIILTKKMMKEGGLAKTWNWAGFRLNRKVVCMIIVTALYIIGMQWIGFYPATFLVVVTSSCLLGSKCASHQLITAAALMCFIYLMFNIVLKIRLPEGVWSHL